MDLRRLTMTENVLTAVRETVATTSEGLETGVTLFGVRDGMSITALAAIGPGPNAVHRPGFHEPDAEYLSQAFAQLRLMWPGLEWIGSLHVHPSGMPGLSGHDGRTLDALLDDPSLGLQEFVAGIIQRRDMDLAIYPYLVSARDRTPWPIPIEIVSPTSARWKAANEHARRRL